MFPQMRYHHFKSWSAVHSISFDPPVAVARVAERGAVPSVPAGRRRALQMLRSFTSPLCPDDYLELINPLWSTRELRGRIAAVQRHSAPAVTIVIKPGWEWPGHAPGQYLRLGIEVDGVH